MARGITRPDYEVDVVGKIIPNPREGGVDVGDGGVAVSLFGAERASMAIATVAALVGIAAEEVEVVGVDVCVM